MVGSASAKPRRSVVKTFKLSEDTSDSPSSNGIFEAYVMLMLLHNLADCRFMTRIRCASSEPNARDTATLFLFFQLLPKHNFPVSGEVQARHVVFIQVASPMDTFLDLQVPVELLLCFCSSHVASSDLGSEHAHVLQGTHAHILGVLPSRRSRSENSLRALKDL